MSNRLFCCAHVASRVVACLFFDLAVIGRALRDDMIDPKELPDCSTLASVGKIDKDAADELLVANRNLAKLLNAARKNANEGDASAREIVDILKAATDVSTQAEQRLDAQLAKIKDRENSECVF